MSNITLVDAGAQGRRLDGLYQRKLMEMRSQIKKHGRSHSLNVLKPMGPELDYLLPNTQQYTSLRVHQNQTIPRNRERRDTYLLPRRPEEYQMNYQQKLIDKSHRSVEPQNRGDFGQIVSRDQVSFLKEVNRVIEAKSEIKRKKQFTNLYHELNNFDPRAGRTSLLYKKFDSNIPRKHEEGKRETKKILQIFKKKILENQPTDWDDY